MTADDDDAIRSDPDWQRHHAAFLTTPPTANATETFLTRVLAAVGMARIELLAEAAADTTPTQATS